MTDLAEVVRAELERGVAEGVFPAGQVAVRSPAGDIDDAIGTTSALDGGRPVTTTTRFDIASLTKALCTSVLLMQAVETGRLRLDDPLARWFPSLPSADAITLELLATHRAGLAAHKRFYDDIEEPAPTVEARRAARRRLAAALLAEPLATEPGATTCYSDLGFILLGWIAEAALGAPLDRLFEERVARPLALERTSFGPVAPDDTAATELLSGGRLVQGVVHDENARVLGGVAGHAGLFSTAAEVARLVAHLASVHRGEAAADPAIVESATVRRFWAAVPGQRFTLGWDTPTEPSSSGRFTTRGASVGHLGFTGCSVWHDLARNLTVVLLTNRIHPTPDRPTPDSEAIRDFRPIFHDRVIGRAVGAE